jgi:ABC-type bacteriocin/lantibiotic exporter with double-glycine peptidase domain
VWSIRKETIGCILLFVAVCITIFRKRLSRKLYPMFGNSRRLFSLGLLAAAVMLSPFSLFQYFTVFCIINLSFSLYVKKKRIEITWFLQTSTISKASLFDIFLTILLVIVFLFVSDCYVESIITTHLKRNTFTKTSLITCFICGIFFNELWNVSELSFSIFLAFLFLVLGIHLFLLTYPFPRSKRLFILGF